MSRRYRVPGTERERTQRGFFARLRLEAFGPEAGVLPHERTLSGPEGGPLQAAAGDRRQHEPGRRAVRRRLRWLRATGWRRSLRRPARRGRHRRRRRPPSAVGRAGRRRRAGEHRRRALLSRGRAGPDDDRRWAPPLRDGAAVPRRAADDALVRGGPAVRLPPGPDARSDPAGPDGAADASAVRGIGAERRGAICSAAPASSSMSSRRVVRWRWLDRVRSAATRPPGSRAGSGCGRAAAARILTARRDAFEPLLPTGGEALRSLDVTLLGSGPRPARRHRRDAVARRRDRLHEVGGEDAVAAVDGGIGRRRGLPARADTRHRRSKPSPATVTSCHRNRPTSIPRP